MLKATNVNLQHTNKMLIKRCNTNIKKYQCIAKIRDEDPPTFSTYNIIYNAFTYVF